MALTEEQEIAQRKLDRDALAERSREQLAHQDAISVRESQERDKHEKQLRRMELLRIARDQLEASAQSKPVGEREITAEQIVAYAETMKAFIHAE